MPFYKKDSNEPQSLDFSQFAKSLFDYNITLAGKVPFQKDTFQLPTTVHSKTFYREDTVLT